MSNEITIKVLKYNDLFTTRNKDIKKLHWFSMPADLLTHPDFFNINGEEFKAFVWIVSIATKCKSDTIRLNISHSEHTIQLKKGALKSVIEKLQGKQLSTDRGLTAASPRPDGGLYITEHNITEHNNNAQPASGLSALSFEALYEKYPRKEGKTKGLSKLKCQIKSPEDYENFTKAVANYSKYCIELKMDQKYIKHFSTFVGEWRDWIDPDVVNKNIPKKPAFDFSKLK